MSRKLTALMLSVFMVLSLLTPFYNLKAQDANLNEGTHHTRPVDVQNAVDYKALEEVADKEEERSFIFVTDESSKVAEKLNEVYETLNANDVAEKGNDYLMKAGFNDAISSALGALDFNSEVKDKIKDLLGKSKGGLLETMSSIFGGSSKEQYDDSDDRNFNVVFSGFTMKMTTEEAMKVRENVPEVKQVFIDYKYNRPDDKPNMYHSTKMVHAPQVWDLGYKGQGRVVAVIDSGADINHPAMRLSDETTVALTQEKVEKLIQDKLLKGQYLNAKFPYGYNFMDHNMDLKDTNKGTGMHGMHVSGTVGANATKEEAEANNGGLIIKGTAPEAQILVMRVFGQDIPTTNTSAYIEAIEESIILGADSMNMSLGSMSGSEQGIDPGMDLALQNARKAGSIVAIAGGNDFYTTWGNDNPRATNPDWGVMGTPGVAESAFTVANYNNESMVTDASTFIKNEKGEEEEVIAKPIDTIDTIVDTGFVSMKEYEIVDVGYGNKESEYNGQDVSGKVVLAYRGKDPKDKDDTSYSANFSAKIELAKKKGAVAFLLGNNEADKPDYFIIMTTETDNLIESYSVTYRSYKAIKQNIEDAKKAGVKPTIKINTKRHELANPGVHKMNESTSWGPNPSLRLKPEITAPGGEIFSTVNVDNGRYKSMTGTSMATPHVAGGVALVNEFLAKKNIKVEGPEKHQFIKNLMMATATPILYENKGGFYNSPRVQGSGLMNLEAALNPNTVTVVDGAQEMSRGKAVVEFGSIKNEKLDFTLKLKNYSDRPVTYDVRGIAQTDQVENGKITFAPLKLTDEVKFGQVRVEANSEATFNGSIDLKGKLEYAERNQPNGFFVEGFIFFDAKADGEGAKEFADLSVPYLAFYGDWAKLPIIDVFADEISLQETGNGKVWIDNIPFWYQGSDYKDFPGRYVDQWNFTHFYSRWSDGGRVIQGQQLWSKKYLDTFAISPNGDSKKDDIAFRGVFLRNADSLKFEFINEDGEVVKTIAEPYRSVIRKNYYDGKFTEDSVWTWRGEDKNGGQVPDGDYKVRITASAQDNKSSEQEYVRTVYVDRVKPEIELLKAEQDGNLVDIEFKAKDDRSGISYMGVYDFIDSNKKEYPYTSEYKQDGEYLVYKAQFTVEDGYDFIANKNSIWIGAMDMAGNYFETTLADVENKGKVIFELKSSDPDDQSFPKELPRLDYRVNENGQDKWYYTTYTNNLMYTDYYVYYPNPFPGYDVEFNPQEFTLSEDNQEQKVEVIFTKVDDKDFGTLDVYIDNALDYRGEITLFAVANYGEKNATSYKIPRKGSYARDAFGVKLPAGEYTIIAKGTGDTPALEIGYEKFEVKPGELTEVGTRLVWRNNLLSFYFRSYVNSLDVIFGNDIIEKKSTDKAGKEVYSYTLENFNKYFDVIDMAADKTVNIDKAKLLEFNYNTDEEYEEVRIDIFINLSGKYKVVPKFDLATISSNVPSIEVWSNFNKQTYKDNAGYMYVYPNKPDKGSLEVTTEFVTKKNVDKPNVMYELYNSRNEPVKKSDNLPHWDNLPQGTYYLRTKIFDGFRPEREEYKIEIYEDKKVDKLNQKLNVRWFHIGEESERKNPIVKFGVNGANAADYGEDIKITLVNVEDNKTYEVSVPIGKSIEELIPNGIYKMTVKLKDGWDYIYFTDKGNGGDRTQGDPDEVAFTESFNYIEIGLTKTEKPDYSTDYKLVIEEEGLDPGANRPKYLLKDNNDKDNYYRTEKAEFINLKPGEYTLYVDVAPTGYEADPMKQVVTITEGENVATAKVKYTIEEGRLLLSPLAKAIENAKRLLENDKKLTDEYRKDLEALVKDGEDYLAKDDKTQDGIFEKAKKINDMVNNPKHIVIPTPIPEPTPDEPIIPEPDYPIIPDYPVIPHRPHRPTTPTKDIVKEPTKPVEKPVEEKKDYGIVETMPTIAATFSDLPENEAAGSIMNMVARGILKGMDNGKFEGELPITRAMVATVLKRLSKDQTINNVTNFTDVKDTDWFAESVKWAQSQGLIKGYEDGTFKANNLVTRQELAVIIERFLKIHGITMEEVKELSYKDLDTLPAWSKDAIIAMAKIGLVEGQTEEMYNPASEFTREELAVMLEKIIIWVEKH